MLVRFQPWASTHLTSSTADSICQDKIEALPAEAGRVFHSYDKGRKMRKKSMKSMVMAEREGFEPSIRFPVYTLSRRAPSTTRPPLRKFADIRLQ